MQVNRKSSLSIQMPIFLESVREKIYEKKLTTLSSSAEQNFSKMTIFYFPTQ